MARTAVPTAASAVPTAAAIADFYCSLVSQSEVISEKVVWFYEASRSIHVWVWSQALTSAPEPACRA